MKTIYFTILKGWTFFGGAMFKFDNNIAEKKFHVVGHR